MSETPIKLYTALLAAMKDFGAVKKDRQNPAFRSSYATLHSILEAVEEPLHNNGIILVQRLGVDEHNAPTLTTELIHAESAQSIGSVVPVVGKDMADPQKVGSAVTYYRRYSLLTLLGLTPEDDDDGNAAARPAPRPAEPRNAPAPPKAQAIPAMLVEIERELAPLSRQVRTNDESLSPGEYARYHALEAARKERYAVLAPDQRTVVSDAKQLAREGKEYPEVVSTLRTLQADATAPQWDAIKQILAAIKAEYYTTQEA